MVSRHVVVGGDQHGVGLLTGDRLKKLGVLQSLVAELGRAYGIPSPASKFCPQAGVERLVDDEEPGHGTGSGGLLVLRDNLVPAHGILDLRPREVVVLAQYT